MIQGGCGGVAAVGEKMDWSLIRTPGGGEKKKKDAKMNCDKE